MNDQSKTKTQLIDELEQTRMRVAELEQVEAALRESEEKYRTIFENVSDSITYVNKYGTIISANNKEEIFGRTPEEIVGKNFTKLGYFDAKDIPKYLKLLKDIIIGKKAPMQMELEVKHKDGHKFPVEMSTSLVKRDGKTVGFVCITRDITEHKQAEQAMRESEERYRSLVESTDDAVYLIGRDMRYEFANRKYLSRLGLSSAELIGQEYGRFHPSDTSEEFVKKIGQVFRSGKPMIYEHLSHRDNKYFLRTLSPVTGEKPGEIRAITVTSKDITERKQAEEELRQSEEKYRQLFATVSDAIVMFDANTRQFLDVNAKAIELYGYTREEFLQMKQPDISADPKASELSISETLAGYRERIPLRYHKKKDDTVFPVEISSAVFNLGDQQVICGVIRDITERKQAEEALRGSEEKYRTLFEQAPVGITTMDLKGVITSCNPAVYQKGGYTEEDLVGKHFSKVAPLRVRDIPRFIGIFNSIIKGETPKPFETTYQRRDGTPGWTEIHTSLLKVGDKKLGIQVIQRDITERKRAEKALRESELQYRTLGETIPYGVWTTDATGYCTYVSDSFIELVDMTMEQIQKFGWLHLLPPEDVAPTKEHWLHCVHTGEDFEREHRFRAKDGCYRNILAIGRPLKDNTGKIIKWVGINLDITERKLAEEALRASEEKFRLLFEHVPVGVFQRTPGGRLFTANPALVDLFGYDSEDDMRNISTTQELYVNPEDQDITARELESMGELKNVELILKRKDGTSITVLENAYAVRGADGKTKYYGGTLIDITERKQASDELRESREQLRSLSAHLQSIREESQKLLAREIHDELGQDLTALKMDLSWMKGKLRQDQELLREKAAAMTKLADAMIKTVKKITARLRPALLDDLGVAAALEWELGEFAERTGIECNLTVKPEEIDLDPDRSTAVYRIFQEALTNIARHSQATSVEAALRVDSGRLEMEISDNGAGITKVQIASPRSFGLIGIRERAMQFGGEVRIEGVKGKGTTISITLPLDDGGDHHD